MKKIAIQGIKGAYHHLAAKAYFGNDIKIVECRTFNEIPACIASGEADYGIMATENSIAGSLLQNYKLLGQSGQHIVGEIYIPIQHCLAALPGQSIDALKEVESHHMAILQCEDFFSENHPDIKLVDSIDTASSALKIKEEQLRNTGAICSEFAAECFGLEILARNIQTIKNNYTRFFIIGHPEVYTEEELNKASVRFVAPHESGSLSRILSVFAIHGINLTKIQSVPIPEKPWEYAFHADLTFPSYGTYKAVMEVISHQVAEIQVLGIYKEWQHETSHQESINHKTQKEA